MGSATSRHIPLIPFLPPTQARDKATHGSNNSKAGVNWTALNSSHTGLTLALVLAPQASLLPSSFLHRPPAPSNGRHRCTLKMLTVTSEQKVTKYQYKPSDSWWPSASLMMLMTIGGRWWYVHVATAVKYHWRPNRCWLRRWRLRMKGVRWRTTMAAVRLSDNVQMRARVPPTYTTYPA